MSENNPEILRILVVDDQQAVGRIVVEMIKAFDSEAEYHDNGMSALGALESKHGVFTDKDMPEMNGVELARRIREQDPIIPIVMISGTDRTDEEIAQTAGTVDRYLMKPLKAAQILDALDFVRDLRQQRLKSQQ